jgi:hypothetical protein
MIVVSEALRTSLTVMRIGMYSMSGQKIEAVGAVGWHVLQIIEG